MEQSNNETVASSKETIVVTSLCAIREVKRQLAKLIDNKEKLLNSGQLTQDEITKRFAIMQALLTILTKEGSAFPFEFETEAGSIMVNDFRQYNLFQVGG